MTHWAAVGDRCGNSDRSGRAGRPWSGDSRAAGKVSLNQPNCVCQKPAGLRVSAGLAPHGLDEPCAHLLEGDAIGTGEPEGSDQTHLGVTDLWVEPKLSPVVGAERAREAHEPGDIQDHRRVARRAPVLAALIPALRPSPAVPLTTGMQGRCHAPPG